TLTRNVARQREIDLRLALGASRGRVVSQLLTESFLIAFLGAVAGVGLAAAAARLLVVMLPWSSDRLTLASSPEATVLCLTIAVAGITVVLFGLLPALRASRPDVHRNLKGGARVTGESFVGRALVAGQLALSLILLVGAGLFAGTMRNLKATDLGF